MAKIEGFIEFPGARLSATPGRLMPPLVDLIYNSKPYAEAESIHDDPRFRALAPAELKALRLQWKEVRSERSRLLSEAGKLDREGQRLYREGVKLEKTAAQLGRKREQLGQAIDQLGRGCADESWRCRRRRSSLQKRARKLERAIGLHNARVAEWRKAVVELERRAG